VLQLNTISHPDTVVDMSRVTLNFDSPSNVASFLRTTVHVVCTYVVLTNCQTSDVN